MFLVLLCVIVLATDVNSALNGWDIKWTAESVVKAMAIKMDDYVKAQYLIECSRWTEPNVQEFVRECRRIIHMTALL